VIRHGRAVFLDDLGAGFQDFPLDLRTGRSNDLHGGADHFGPDSVARDETDAMH